MHKVYLRWQSLENEKTSRRMNCTSLLTLISPNKQVIFANYKLQYGLVVNHCQWSFSNLINPKFVRNYMSFAGNFLNIRLVVDCIALYSYPALKQRDLWIIFGMLQIFFFFFCLELGMGGWPPFWWLAVSFKFIYQRQLLQNIKMYCPCMYFLSNRCCV